MNTNDGLITVPSNRSFDETQNRLEAALREKGIHLFAKIDHGEGAKSVGLPLRPTVVLLFGNPKAGTPLMQSDQRIGIDLPLKVLVWEDEKGKAWLTYNDPAYLAERHHITDRAEAVTALSAGLQALVNSVK